jgi:DNA polymerase alpha subunit A
MDAFMDIDDDDLNDPVVKEESRGDDNLPKKMDLNFGDKKHHKVTNAVPVKTESDTPSWLSVYDSLSIATDDSLGPLTTSTLSVNSSKISALEPDGSLRFYWLDYLEHEGKIYFIGKLKDKVSGLWVSCCVTVEGLQRNLFALPRERRVEQDDDGQLYDTDVIPEMKDVYEDFDRIRRKVGVKAWKAKSVKRKYAFGEVDVPREETQWLKVVYNFDGKSHSPRRSIPMCSPKKYRTSNTDQRVKPKHCSYLWHRHQRFRAFGGQTQDYGPVLATDQEPADRQQRSQYHTIFAFASADQ